MTSAEPEPEPQPEPGPEPESSGEPEPEPEPAPGAAGLSARDQDVLALERRGWPTPGLKERAIRERLGISPTRYYQVLNALLDDPKAQEHDPVTVNRLRRVRTARRSRR
ncbi:DUF3263 domain-containing protein [Streptomyces boluensis]|uniref:DUF3263 domain-containing protein n=1 Tax=Streptomyces boluensis TaxID=1775135 RepID=A0A964USI2_9ACTN|nr:DUF3263 domain-containing protein [Streptomyces boluensis]NBE54614.1 DUF3263 domain-containing protein [Streptomyces boluensis]